MRDHELENTYRQALGGDRAEAMKVAMRYVRDLAGAVVQDSRKASLNGLRPIADTESYATEKRELRRDGVVIIPDFLPQSWAREMRMRILSLIENGRSSRKLESGAKVQNRDEEDADYDVGMIDIVNIHLEIPELNLFANDNRVLDIVSAAAGRRLRLNRTHAYVNENSVRPRGYHLDNFHFFQFKAFLLLGDLPDRSFGTYSFIRGSHRFSMYKYFRMLTGAVQGLDWGNMFTTDVSQEVICSGTAGTLLITDQNGFHRGQVQQQGVRVMLVSDYEPR